MTGRTKTAAGWWGRCRMCDGEPHWEIERRGDAVVSWACNDHLAAECDRLQRDWEVTRLSVVHWAKQHEVAEINRTLQGIAEKPGP